MRLEVGRRDDAAVAACRAEELKMEEAALPYELAESTVLGISARGESVSSWTRATSDGRPPLPEPEPGLAKPFASAVDTVAEAEAEVEPVAAPDSKSESGARAAASADFCWSRSRSRSRSVRTWPWDLTFGAVGKNCAKLAPGGRVILAALLSYRLDRAPTMIPLRAGGLFLFVCWAGGCCRDGSGGGCCCWWRWW